MSELSSTVRFDGEWDKESTDSKSQEEKVGPGTWPRGVDRVPRHSIGAVVSILCEEFPATTVSKVRFLEDQGLVKPFRTATGYRKYSSADIERIRFILAQQRDSYAPLKAIHEHLVSLDGGHDVEPEPTARLVTSGGAVLDIPKEQSVTLRALGDLTGTTSEFIEDCVNAGLIHPDLGGHFSSLSVKIVSLASSLATAGIEPRLLRTVRTSAERCADLAERVITSRESRNRPGDRERNRAKAHDLSQTIGDLHEQLLRSAIYAIIED
jgi:Predicted transcriptional regulators